MQMNSTPLPTTPHFATLDWGWRKKMVWEVYATAIDTVADPKAGCRPCVVSDAYKAAIYLVQSMAHLLVSLIHDIIKHLAQAANTGAILQRYLGSIASAALEQVATTSRLLTGSTPSNAASSRTPSERKVHGIIQKYEKLMQMNSPPLPTTPHFATLDWDGRKKMVWEMYATAIDTVAEAKARKTWLAYTGSSDVLILKVVCKVEQNMASSAQGALAWVAEVYMTRTRDALAQLRKAEFVLAQIREIASASRIVSPGWGKAGGF